MRFPRDRFVLTRKLRVLLRNEAYEAKEAHAVVRLVRPDDVVLELGAGIGFMSTLISTQIGAKEIHSFEANPRLIRFIRQVHNLNAVKNATVYHAVLGKGTGSEVFYARPNILESSLSPLPSDTEEVKQVEVPRGDINEAIEEINPTVLVCDIEGAEADLVPMMDLSGIRAVVIELHPQYIGKEGIARIFAKMAEAGLVFFPRWSNGKVAVFRNDW